MAAHNGHDPVILGRHLRAEAADYVFGTKRVDEFCVELLVQHVARKHIRTAHRRVRYHAMTQIAVVGSIGSYETYALVHVNEVMMFDAYQKAKREIEN